MGGHWAVWLSQQTQLPIVSTVLYHAARGGHFSKSHSAFLARYTERDEWVSQTAKARMTKAIQTAGLPLESYTYTGTEHWFAESGDNTKSNRAAPQLAFERTIARLSRTLTP
jgi:dienelactone hydrolase